MEDGRTTRTPSIFKGAILPAFLPWFYQASLSKKVGNQQISVVSSRRMPLQIAVQGRLFHPSEWVNIKGRVVDGKGAGLADVVLHYA